MSTEDFRNKGKAVIANYVKLDKNIKILEKNIFNLIPDNEEKVDLYFNLVYEVCYLLQNNDLKKVNEIIKKKGLDWNNERFNFEKQKQLEKDEFITNPFDVQEGIETCGKCGSNKTYSYSMQVRAADEGFSTFSKCLKCEYKWRTN